MNESEADLRQVAEKLRELEGRLRESDLPDEKVIELIRESARLAAEAGTELERCLRTADTGPN